MIDAVKNPYATNENEHHKAADANQKAVGDHYAGSKQVTAEIMQRASAVEALLAIDMNLGRIADSMEALVVLARKVP
jgi:hypothetical protein